MFSYDSTFIACVVSVRIVASTMRPSREPPASTFEPAT